MPSPQKVKGKSFENAKAKFLTEIYGEKFIRVPTSGAFLGGQNYDRRHTMSQGQIMAFKGDIIPPDDWVYFNCECKFYKDFKTVINPSCEHMTDEWYHNLAEGTMVILQSNDFWEVPEHINVVKNIEEMKKKYKMKDIYSCTLQCTVYQRFTLAGIKTAESILP